MPKKKRGYSFVLFMEQNRALIVGDGFRDNQIMGEAG